MEREEGALDTITPTECLHLEVHDAMECADPTNHIVACSDDGPKADNREGPGVMSGRV